MLKLKRMQLDLILVVVTVVVTREVLVEGLYQIDQCPQNHRLGTPVIDSGPLQPDTHRRFLFLLNESDIALLSLQ